VTALPPDGATVEVDCSDASVADELRRRFAARDDAKHVRVELLPRSDQPERMLVASAIGDVRREPSHRSELVNQVIHGDGVTPLKREGEWVLARVDDGYIGWIRDWHLKPWSRAREAAFAARASHRVRSNYALVMASAGSRALPVIQLVVGTRLAAATATGRGWVAVELADGKHGFARKGDIEPVRTARPTPKRLADTGLRFLGIPYLWGGNTPAGFDCSGVVQRVFLLHGVQLPRDSDMQARIGHERRIQGPGDIRPGDLLFFGKSRDSITHVGLVLPDRTFLHAYGQVIVNSLDTGHEHYDERLASIWRMTRNPLARTRS
jgi:hypothetical protein